MKHFLASIFRRRSRDEARDTGLALVLLLLLLSVFLRSDIPVKIGIAALVLAIVAPGAFQPAAVVWFALAELMGNVMSRVILSVVFFVVITPIGLLRRILGQDPLLLKSFRRGGGEAMKVREHVYAPADLERPY